MKLLMVGDTHGNTRHMLNVIKIAKKEDCTYIVQLGDFGLWDHYPEGVEFLDEVEASLEANNLTLYWIGGNHENYDRIEQYINDDPSSGPFVKIRDQILYIKRGAAWTWDGVAFLAMGGAFSIDKNARVPGRSWWPQESITDQDVTDTIESGTLLQPSILLTHEAPDGCPLDNLVGFFYVHKKLEEICQAQREKVSAVVRATKPELIYHGHYHTRLDYTLEYVDNDYEYRTADVIALGWDGAPGQSCEILDLEEYQWK